MVASKSSPEKASASPDKIDVSKLEIDKAEVERITKLANDIRLKEKQEDKQKALEDLLSTYFTKNYLLTKVDNKFQLGARVTAITDSQETKDKVKATAAFVSKLLNDVQTLPCKIEQDDKGVKKYTLSDVFMNVFGKILTNNTLTTSLQGQSKFSKDITEEQLSAGLDADNKPIGGTLQVLLENTRNLKGDALKARNDAVKQIATAMQDAKKATETNPMTPILNDIGAGFVEQGGEALNGLKYLTNNLGDKGMLGLVDSVPKIGALFGFLLSSFIPGDGPLKTALQWWTGGTFAFQNVSMNGDPIKVAFSKIGGALNFFTGAPAEAAEGNSTTAPASSPDTTAKAPLTAEQQQQQAEYKKAVDALYLRGMSDQDKLVLKNSINAPVSMVLNEINGLPVTNGNYEWDVKVNDLTSKASLLLDQQGKDALKNGSVKVEDIQRGYYDNLAMVGKAWRHTLERTMGREFTEKRSDAYLAWYMMKFKVFTTESQNAVLENTKNFVNPNTNFAVATYLMLDRSSGALTGEAGVAKQLSDSREQVGLRIANLKTLKEDFQTYEKNPTIAPSTLNTASATGSAGTEAPARAATSQDTPGTAPQTDLQREGNERKDKQARIEALKAQGYYTEDQIRELGNNKVPVVGGALAERAVQSQITTIINYIQTGKVDAALKAIQAADSKADQFNVDRGRAIRTLFIRLYESQQLVSYEDKIEQLRANFSGMA